MEQAACRHNCGGAGWGGAIAEAINSEESGNGDGSQNDAEADEEVLHVLAVDKVQDLTTREKTNNVRECRVVSVEERVEGGNQDDVEAKVEEGGKEARAGIADKDGLGGKDK